MSSGALVARQDVARLVVEAGEGRPSSSLVVTQQVAKLAAVAEQGPPGRDAVGGSFGQITYTDRSIGAEDVFAPNIRQQLRFNPTTMTTQDKLLPPFMGHAFFANDVLKARAMDDVYTICINLLVMSDQAGGKIKMDVDTGSTLGPLQADDKSLFASAGVIERVTFRFDITVLTTFLANGARFFLTSTRPITVSSETLFLVPLTIQPAASP